MSADSVAPSVIHSAFTIERVYDAAPGRVFKAFADPVAKRGWFAEGEGWDIEGDTLDFRVGGFERSTFRFRGGPLVSVGQGIAAPRGVKHAAPISAARRRSSRKSPA